MKKSVIIALGATALLGAGAYVYAMRPLPGAASGLPLVKVSVPRLSAAELAGKAAYDAKCADCHGDNASGRDGLAPPLVHPIYEPGHHADESFMRAAMNGARAHHWRFGDMPPVDGITAADVAGIVTYVRTLQRANGIN